MICCKVKEPPRLNFLKDSETPCQFFFFKFFSTLRCLSKQSISAESASQLRMVNIMARNFGHARAVNIQTLENLKQYGYTFL